LHELVGIQLEFQISKLSDENHQLKEEFEKYRIKTNYLLKTAELVVKKVSFFLFEIKTSRMFF
jgi:glucose-6-phosphate-specific signal transduction histidine kinase